MSDSLENTRRGPVAYGSPIGADGPRIPLYSTEFAADPHHAYREMRRRYGSLVPVDLAPDVPATLVIGYYTALRIPNDPDHFPADSRTWQQSVPADCPIRPMLEWRPSATLAFAVINSMLGCPPDIGQRAAAGFAAILDGVHAAEGNAMLGQAMLDLVSLKQTEPGEDVVSRLLVHPARLDDEEMIHQVVGLFGAGIEPTQNMECRTARVPGPVGGIHGGAGCDRSVAEPIRLASSRWCRGSRETSRPAVRRIWRRCCRRRRRARR